MTFCRNVIFYTLQVGVQSGCCTGNKKETKQQQGTAGPGNILGCCSVSLRFLCDIHSIHPVVPQGNNFCILSCGGWAMLNNRFKAHSFAELCMRAKSKKRGLLPGLSEFSLMLAQFLLRSASLVFRNKWRRESSRWRSRTMSQICTGIYRAPHNGSY